MDRRRDGWTAWRNGSAVPANRSKSKLMLRAHLKLFRFKRCAAGDRQPLASLSATQEFIFTFSKMLLIDEIPVASSHSSTPQRATFALSNLFGRGPENKCAHFSGDSRAFVADRALLLDKHKDTQNHFVPSCVFFAFIFRLFEQNYSALKTFRSCACLRARAYKRMSWRGAVRQRAHKIRKINTK